MRALRVCIQALINSAASSLPPWHSCLPGAHASYTDGVYLRVCACVCVCKHRDITVTVVCSCALPHPPSARLARLPSCVRFCEASRSHRMEHNYPLLAVNPCPQTRAFLDCIHKQTSTHSPPLLHLCHPLIMGVPLTADLVREWP